MVDISQPCFLSVASLWEITIKQQIGKLTLSIPLLDLFEFANRNLIEVIPITFDHLIALSKLEKHHSDPFDRLIVAQAQVENLDIVSCDLEFQKYDVKIRWD